MNCRRDFSGDISRPAARFLADDVADGLNRFDESTAISDLLELHELDGIAYVLEGLADAIVCRERQERLRRLTSAGRPPKRCSRAATGP